jgi:hypothetical protein
MRAKRDSVGRFVRPVCPRCGCPARFLRMTARVVCVLNEDGTIGRTEHVGKRVGAAEYECGGGHKFGSNDKLSFREKEKS